MFKRLYLPGAIQLKIQYFKFEIFTSLYIQIYTLD